MPGRGKSFIARKLQSFLTWRGNECKIFNVGKYRRVVQEQFGASGDADFFDTNNEHANLIRQKSAEVAMEAMLEWLDFEEKDEEELNAEKAILQIASKASFITSRIAIFDATNSTVERRRWVLEEATSPIKRLGKKTGCVFVESICDDDELLEENFRFKVKNSPDFADMTEEEAIADLRSRVEKYEAAYETIEDDTQSYIKIFNLSSKLLVNHIYGRMAKTMVPCLMSWNIGSRPIYLVRAGETQGSYSDEDTRLSSHGLRGDTLGPRGIAFRNALEDFIRKEGEEFNKKSVDAMKSAMGTRSILGTSVYGLAPIDFSEHLDEKDVELPFHMHIMSSTMPRAVETVSWETLPFVIDELPNLNPLDKGDYSGMELDEIKEINPAFYAMLEKDPFLTRFPGGECYADLINRLETCIIDMEQQVNMACLVSHVSVLQVLMAYFRRSPIKECTSIEVPMHTVIKYSPSTGGGWTESIHELHVEGHSLNERYSRSDSALSNDSALSWHGRESIFPVRK